MQSRKVRLYLFGGSGVGKTSLLNNFLDNSSNGGEIGLKMGVDIKVAQIVVEDVLVSLEIWDANGFHLENYTPIIANSQMRIAVLFIYDVTNEKSFSEAIYIWKNWVEKNHQNSARTGQLVLVGNKCDLIYDRKISYQMGCQVASEMGVAFTETSARTGENVIATFRSVAETVQGQIEASKLRRQKLIEAAQKFSDYSAYTS